MFHSSIATIVQNDDKKKGSLWQAKILSEALLCQCEHIPCTSSEIYMGVFLVFGKF